jgi:hypothetical protein
MAAGVTVLPAASYVASAQSYPSRPVRLIVGFAAGGPADISARLIGQWLSERLGQTFIIENRPGAGGNLATEMVVRARPDGYKLLEASSTNAWNTTLYRNLSFDFMRDIAPVGSICRYAGVMVVHPSLPAESVPQFIDYANANPGKINMSGGAGAPSHFYGELFKKLGRRSGNSVSWRRAGGSSPGLAGRCKFLWNRIWTITHRLVSCDRQGNDGNARTCRTFRRAISPPATRRAGECVGAPKDTPQTTRYFGPSKGNPPMRPCRCSTAPRLPIWGWSQPASSLALASSAGSTGSRLYGEVEQADPGGSQTTAGQAVPPLSADVPYVPYMRAR